MVNYHKVGMHIPTVTNNTTPGWISQRLSLGSTCTATATCLMRRRRSKRGKHGVAVRWFPTLPITNTVSRAKVAMGQY